MNAISTVIALGLLGSFAHAETKFPDLFPQDECAFIRTALKNLPASGGEVTIPAGTFVCKGPIILDKDGTTLRGAGRNQTILKLAPNTNSSNVIMGQIEDVPSRVTRNIVVRDMTLDGTRLEQSQPAADFECWTGRCYVPGVSLIRNNGISVRRIEDSMILNVTTKSAASGGVVTEHGVVNLVVDGLDSHDNHFDGYAGYVTTNTIVRNAKLHHNQGAGVSLDLDYNGNTFSNMEIHDNGDLGVYQRWAHRNLWENITLSRNKKNGMYVSIADDHVESCPTDNEYRNLTMIDNGWAGFFLGGPCKGNRVTGTTTLKGNGKLNGDQACFHIPDSEISIEGEVVCDKPTLVRK